MEVKVCQSCKHLFNYIAGPVICPQCRLEEDKKFKVVKEYLWDNPGAGLQQVSEDTGISTKLVLRFLKEGRLEVSGDSPIQLTCEVCGKKIRTGTRCPECESELLKSLNQMKGTFMQKDDGEVKSKMRFLNSDRFKN